MTVVLVDPRRPSLVPVEAIELLAGDVQYTEEMPVRVPWSLPAARPSHDGEQAPVLLTSDPDHPQVTARLAAGERLISAPGPQPGERLIDAVALMDKLRTDGPWESEQTHDSLRRYLLEETYELFDAVRDGDVQQLREELGDVLLQVLFHARIAEDSTPLPFNIDDVADSLVRKLVHRVPGVLAGEPISLEQQLAQWEERKATEKPRSSSMDDVPTGQPALALTQKVYERVIAAGLPADLVPDDMVSVGVGLGGDAENALRTATLEFMDTVRKVEHSIAASRRGEDVPEVLDIAQLGTIAEEEWRAHWPTLGPESQLEVIVPAEPAEEPEEPEAAVETEEPEAADEPEEPAEPEGEATEADSEDDAVAQAKSVEPQ
jgi:XTP/dITP diphosphohydrolase